MKANTNTTTGKAYAAMGALLIAVSFTLLFLGLVQVARGSMSYTNASAVTYDSLDPAAVARVRRINIVRELGVLTSAGIMFMAGSAGVKHGGQAKRIKRGIVLAATSTACFVTSAIYYETVLKATYNAYDIYPSSSIPIMIPILALLAGFIALGIKSRKSVRENGTQATR